MNPVSRLRLDNQSSSPARTEPETPEASTLEVSVVIPCLNEAESIGRCIDVARAAFEAAGIRGEVVVADNGSTDGSDEIAELHGARVVQATVTGYGSALRKGIQESRGEFIIMGDADGSHDFSEIPRFVAKWQEGYEFVVGNRFRGEIKNGAMSWHHRHIGTPVLAALLNLFFRARVGDINCGMRGITKNLARQLEFRTTGMEFASESLIKAVKYEARLAEVPITMWPETRNRPPHLRTFRDGWRHLRYIMLCAPNWLFLAPGGFLAALGMGIVIWLISGPRFAGKVGLDLHTISLAMMFVLIGVHIISIGLFVKVFCYTEKLSRNQRTLEKWLKRIRLEHGLLLGVLMMAAGFTGDAIVFWRWASAGFGQLHSVRAVFFCSLALLLGVEILFSSVFLSMLGIDRETYIGD